MVGVANPPGVSVNHQVSTESYLGDVNRIPSFTGATLHITKQQFALYLRCTDSAPVLAPYSPPQFNGC